MQSALWYEVDVGVRVLARTKVQVADFQLRKDSLKSLPSDGVSQSQAHGYRHQT